MRELASKQEYDTKGMLEPDMDNEYTRQIADWSKLMAQYEDEYAHSASS